MLVIASLAVLSAVSLLYLLIFVGRRDRRLPPGLSIATSSKKTY